MDAFLILVFYVGLPAWIIRKLHLSSQRKREEDQLRRVAANNREQLRTWKTDLAKALTLQHRDKLLRARSRLTIVNEYGVAHLNAVEWELHIETFLIDVCVRNDPQVLAAGVPSTQDQLVSYFCRHYSHCCHMVSGWLDEAARLEPAVASAEVSSMGGTEFEEYCAQNLVACGWRTRATSASRDQGVDIIAEHGSMSVAVQCKNWATNVGNQAVQQVEAGRQFHGANFGVVVTRHGYTAAARDLALATGVLLLTFDELPEMRSRLLDSFRA